MFTRRGRVLASPQTARGVETSVPEIFWLEMKERGKRERRSENAFRASRTCRIDEKSGSPAFGIFASYRARTDRGRGLREMGVTAIYPVDALGAVGPRVDVADVAG